MTVFDALPFLVDPSAAERQVRTPVWRITIRGRDVTREISPFVTAVTYTDHSHGKSDDIAVAIADADGRWRNAWYPTKGDVVQLWIGYFGEPLLPCGDFSIDEVELEGPPDVVTIKGLATGVTQAVRTKRSTAHEGKTLPQIVDTVAARHGFRVVGTIEPIVVERSTQRNEDDLAYLTRLAEAYGYVFSLRGEQLVFYQLAALRAAAPTVIIKRSDIAQQYRLVEKIRTIYKACEITYHDPARDRDLKRKIDAVGATSGDVLRITERVESPAQADAKARAALERANAGRAKGTLPIMGDARLAAGRTVQIQGFGLLDGSYLIKSSQHRMTRTDGYTTDVEVDGATA